MGRVRRPKDKRRIGLKLSAAGQDDDVLQKTQRARFAAILVIDFAVNVIRVGELDQPRARFEVAVVPPLEDQPSAWAVSNEPGQGVASRAFGGRREAG